MMDLTWQELYKAALLEIRPEELRPRIERAEAAIQLRLQELGQTDGNPSDERHAIADAMRSLRTLANTECRPANYLAASSPVRAGLAS
jgi:hypothetical protein